jgi:hypothetical protein
MLFDFDGLPGLNQWQDADDLAEGMCLWLEQAMRSTLRAELKTSLPAYQIETCDMQSGKRLLVTEHIDAESVEISVASARRGDVAAREQFRLHAYVVLLWHGKELYMLRDTARRLHEVTCNTLQKVISEPKFVSGAENLIKTTETVALVWAMTEESSGLPILTQHGGQRWPFSDFVDCPGSCFPERTVCLPGGKEHVYELSAVGVDLDVEFCDFCDDSGTWRQSVVQEQIACKVNGYASRRFSVPHTRSFYAVLRKQTGELQAHSVATIRLRFVLPETQMSQDGATSLFVPESHSSPTPHRATTEDMKWAALSFLAYRAQCVDTATRANGFVRSPAFCQSPAAHRGGSVKETSVVTQSAKLYVTKPGAEAKVANYSTCFVDGAAPNAYRLTVRTAPVRDPAMSRIVNDLPRCLSDVKFADFGTLHHTSLERTFFNPADRMAIGTATLGLLRRRAELMNKSQAWISSALDYVDTKRVKFQSIECPKVGSDFFCCLLESLPGPCHQKFVRTNGRDAMHKSGTHFYLLKIVTKRIMCRVMQTTVPEEVIQHRVVEAALHCRCFTPSCKTVKKNKLSFSLGTLPKTDYDRWYA